MAWRRERERDERCGIGDGSCSTREREVRDRRWELQREGEQREWREARTEEMGVAARGGKGVIAHPSLGPIQFARWL